MISAILLDLVRRATIAQSCRVSSNWELLLTDCKELELKAATRLNKFQHQNRKKIPLKTAHPSLVIEMMVGDTLTQKKKHQLQVRSRVKTNVWGVKRGKITIYSQLIPFENLILASTQTSFKTHSILPSVSYPAQPSLATAITTSWPGRNSQTIGIRPQSRE